MASSCILADRLDEARLHLDRLRSITSKPTYDWERVVLVAPSCWRGRWPPIPTRLRRLLRGWAAETARALKVEGAG